MNNQLHKHKRWILTLLVLLGPTVAGAVSLGRLNVLSSLGQPLAAEVDLVSIEKDELSTLSVRLASPELYRLSNLQYNAALAGLRFQIDKRSNGQPYLRLTSERVVSDPFVDLLIEVQWAAGRLVREYTALIDPADYAAPPPSPVTAAAVPPATRTLALPLPLPPTAAAAPPAGAAASGSEYGPVKRGETLSRIATSVKREGVSLEQMMVGILRHNPDAFMGNNMNRLKANKMLRIPVQGQLITLAQADALREVQLQLGDQGRTRRKLLDITRTAAAKKAVTRPRDKANVSDKSTEEKAVLRLSSGAAARDRSKIDRTQLLTQELLARERALDETNQRIKELENGVKASVKPRSN